MRSHFWPKPFCDLNLAIILVFEQVIVINDLKGFPGGLVVKNSPAMQEPHETRVQSLGREDILEKGMATLSSFLAWRIPWTKEPGGLQSLGSQKSDTT